MASRNHFGANYEHHPMVAPIWSRLGDIETRIDRLEKSISTVLRYLKMPIPDTLPLENPDAVPEPVESVHERPTEKQEDVNQESKAADPVSSEPHTYQTLNPERSEIRLLALWGNLEDSSIIIASLVHVSLDDTPPANVQGMTIDEKRKKYALQNFTALSYTWQTPGEPQTKQPILLNGHRFLITRNLEHAIRNVRKTELSQPNTYLWVDQICILLTCP
jgi:Heterokaryon incompatibility protein (HET)